MMNRLKKILATLKKYYAQPTVHSAYRIVSLDKDKTEQHVATIQVINKNITFKQRPEEILADDKMVEHFSQRDIRSLTYLGYMNVNAPQYTILAKKHSEKLNRMIFALHKKGESSYSAKTADQIAISEDILSDLSPKEAYIIGYMAAAEQHIVDEEEKLSLKREALSQ